MNLTANFNLFWQSWAQSPFAARLASTLLHFLWQGAVLGAAAFMLLVAFKHALPQLRYIALLIVLAAMATCPIATWFVVRPDVRRDFASDDPAPANRITAVSGVSKITPKSSEFSTVAQAQAGHSADSIAVAKTAATLEGHAPAAAVVAPPAHTSRTLTDAVTAWLRPSQPWVAATWLLGVVLFELRLAIGLIANERACRRGLTPVGESVEEIMAVLCDRLLIRHAVRVFESCLTETPALLGWVSPIILLPASALCELPPLQLQAILAHELAHVRRHDYLANLLQTLIETLLYYHPAVWWISRQIRIEREHCCDDVAVELCGDRVIYARALASLEELRAAPTHFVVAASGGSLAERIRRIIGRTKPSGSGGRELVGLLAATILVFGAIGLAHHEVRASASIQPANEQQPARPHYQDDRSSQPARKIAGRIVDEVGKPVVAAHVWWEVSTNPTNGGASDLMIDGISDAAGRFELAVPPDWQPRPNVLFDPDLLWVFALGKNLVLASAIAGLETDGNASNWTIHVEPASQVSFLVLKPDGTPAKDALVEPYRVPDLLKWYAFPPDIVARQMRVVAVETGRARLVGVSEKALCAVKVTLPAFGSQLFALDDKGVSAPERLLRLSAVGRIEGRLIANSRAAVRGIRIGFNTTSDESGSAAWSEVNGTRYLKGRQTTGMAHVVTDDNGRFVVPALSEGVVSAKASLSVDPPLAPRISAEKLHVGETLEIEAPMEQTVRVRGVIRMADTKQPVAGAWISLNTESISGQRACILSDAKGRFEARVLPGVVRTQVISLPSRIQDRYVSLLEPRAKPQFVSPGIEPVDLAPIELNPARPETGTVLDHQGRPVAKWDISAIWHRQRFGRGTSDSEGNFTFPVPKQAQVEKYEARFGRGNGILRTVRIASPQPLMLKLDPPNSKSENLADAGREIQQARSTPPMAPQTYEFHVVNTRNKPIAGAKVTVWAVGWKEGRRSGSFGVDDKLFPPTTSDAHGVVKIVFPTQGEGRTMDLLRAAEKKELSEVALTVDHPEHPIWDYYINLDGKRRIMLSDPTKVVIRAHREHETGLLRHLYPVLAGAPFAPEVADWSERDGVLTVPRLDLTGEHAFGLLRVAEFPEKGPLLFSDLVDLKKHVEDPITLDLVLKPGVRVEGKLDAQVPRPIKNGRVVAGIQTGHNDYGNNWGWEATATIAADGTFVFESLPPDENLQLIAVCDGWVSTSPTRAEVMKYAEANQFGVDYRGPMNGVVSPHPYRLKGAAIQPVVPMRRAANCEVHVADEANKPLGGAQVDFSPNQKWLNGGATFLGAGVDYATVMRGQLASGVHTANPNFQQFGERFRAKTDARGVALVQNLPVEASDETVTSHMTFAVSCKGYQRTKKLLQPSTLSVSLSPGETAQVTVHLKHE